MYERYWQLESRPFENTSDPQFYYPGETHQGALLRLRYAIENRQGGALLAGAAGLGKTLLVRALARQLPEPYGPLVHLVFPQMPPDQLMAYLAAQLAANRPASTPGIEQSVRCIEQALGDLGEQGRNAIVVIDEAHLLQDSQTLETLRLLLNFEHAGRPALTLLLVGQPALLPALERMPELEQRLSVKCLLRRFSLEETISYVSHRLTAAGATRSLFDPTALEAVHQLAHGVARQINRLCDLALLIGYAEEQPHITATQVEAVADELVAVSPE